MPAGVLKLFHCYVTRMYYFCTYYFYIARVSLANRTTLLHFQGRCLGRYNNGNLIRYIRGIVESIYRSLRYEKRLATKKKKKRKTKGKNDERKSRRINVIPTKDDAPRRDVSFSKAIWNFGITRRRSARS